MSDLLQQAVASGQVSAAQIEKHWAAGELGKSISVQMPPLPGPDWATNTTGSNGPQYWTAKSMQAYAQAYAESLRSELEAARAALIEINDTLPGTATPQQYARHIHKIACTALCNTKEQSK